jgi:hypothetical protein
MTVPSASPEAVAMIFDTNTTSKFIYPISSTWISWDDYFGNTGSNCPIRSCTLYDSNCLIPFSDSKVTMELSSPWDITAIMDDPDGYTKSMCV